MHDLSNINWPLWLSTMVPLTLSAGPGNLLVATSGARSGMRRSVRFIAGLDTTYFVLAVLIGLGLYRTLMDMPMFVDGLRIAGSLYILWLGVRLIRRPVEGPTDSGRDFLFRDGIVTQLGNVKGMVMLLVMFSTFIPNGSANATIVLGLSAALITLNVFSHFLWVSMGATVQALMQVRPKLLNLQNTVFGLMLILVAVWMFFRSGTL